MVALVVILYKQEPDEDKMKAKPMIIFLGLLGLGYGAFLLYVQMLLLKKTCIKVVKYSLAGVLTKQASLTLTLQVTNNSDIDLQAKKGSFKIYLNDVFISDVPVTITKVVKAHSTVEIPLVAYFNPVALVKQGLQTLLNSPDNIKIRVAGKVNVTSNYIAINNLKIDETLLLSEILQPKQNTTC